MSDMDEDKIKAAYEDLVRVYQKHKLTVPEILTTYGNLGFCLGAAIGGHKDSPTVDELEKLYAIKPTVDIALMIQGLLVATWSEDIKKKVEEIKENA